MRETKEKRQALILFAATIAAGLAVWVMNWVSNLPVQEAKIDPSEISRISGMTGRFDYERSVFRYTEDRALPGVAIGGVEIPTAFGSRAWAAVTGTTKHAVMTGDLPLLESEVNETIRLAVDLGLDVTALHNRFLSDSPRIFSLHFAFVGTQDAVAVVLGKLFRGLRQKNDRSLNSIRMTAHLSKERLSEEAVSKLRWKGELKDGIYRVSLAYGTKLSDEILSDPMGASSWAMFAGNEREAVVNGEIATVEKELRPILKVLIEKRLQIVSIHEHFSKENPKLSFVHFLGSGELKDLADRVWDAAEKHEGFISK